MQPDKVCQSGSDPGTTHRESFSKQKCYLDSELTLDNLWHLLVCRAIEGMKACLAKYWGTAKMLNMLSIAFHLLEDNTNKAFFFIYNANILIFFFLFKRQKTHVFAITLQRLW